jgi:hypothetical protein
MVFWPIHSLLVWIERIWKFFEFGLLFTKVAFSYSAKWNELNYAFTLVINGPNLKKLLDTFYPNKKGLFGPKIHLTLYCPFKMGIIKRPLLRVRLCYSFDKMFCKLVYIYGLPMLFRETYSRFTVLKRWIYCKSFQLPCTYSYNEFDAKIHI